MRSKPLKITEEWLTGLDDSARRLFEPYTDTPAVRALDLVSKVGDQPGLRLIAGTLLTMGTFAGRDRLVRAGARMLIAHEAATVAKDLAKTNIDRARPRSAGNGAPKTPKKGDHTTKEKTSFPSGHSAGAIAAARAFSREFPEYAPAAIGAAATIAALQIPRCAHYRAAGVQAKPGLIGRIASYLRQHGAQILVEALVNFILPFLIYNYAEAPLGEVDALLASSAPPILWSLVEFARHGRVDALSVLVVSGIALSLLAMIGGGGARFLQLREKLVTGIIGLVFLGSAAIRKPLIYELARAGMRRKSEDEAQKFEALQVHAAFRRTMTVMTLVWGFGFLADVALSVALIFLLSIRQYLLVSPVIGYGTMGALSLWTFVYGQRAKRRGEARRAAAEVAAGIGPATSA